MTVVAFLLLLLAVVVAIVLVPVVGSALSPSNRDRRAELREARAETAAVKQREKIAVAALRAIANGAGAPVLEASDALDRIESTYQKEITS